MQTVINIAPELLNWVESHMQIDKISESMTKNLLQWKSGDKKPTFNQVEAFSNASNIPLGYFFLKTPPVEDLSLLKFRTIDSLELQNPSRNLIDTIHDMENVQEWMRNYMIASDGSPVEFVGSLDSNNDIHDIVKKIRNELGLTLDWYTKSKSAGDSLRIIRECAENIGILVMLTGIVGSNTHRKLEINEFRAFTLTDEYAPLVFINSNDSDNGKLFSLLHEIAHIWLGTNSLFNDRYSKENNVSNTETICNAIAGELLIPQNIFIKKWDSLSDNYDYHEKIETTAYYFKCGSTVAARKALKNNFINLQQYYDVAETAVKFYTELMQKKKNDESGGDYYNTVAFRIDKRFFNSLVNNIREGKTLYTDAFRLTHTNHKTFATLVEKVCGEPL